ncbi:MAG TPA: hypothetical protein VFH26_01740 [Gemmatimonadales bacterium]|nr:hypothetical protein [Gemmatimonadales bacterium]
MDLERRISPRNPPSYTALEVDDLRITRVHFREGYLFCLLSDGNMVCVPITISGVLVTAPLRARYQWKIAEDGKSVLWSTQAMGVVTERVGLADILEHPDARVSLLRPG